jgi:hypothetical protein
MSENELQIISKNAAQVSNTFTDHVKGGDGVFTRVDSIQPLKLYVLKKVSAGTTSVLLKEKW